jgi:hypothetical protein
MKKAKKAIGNTKAVTNKGKATTAATAKSGPKPAVMNRRKYNEAISGDTMSNYAMYKKGGKVKGYQSGGFVDKVLTKTEEIAKRSPTAAKVMSKIGDVAIGAGKAVEKYGPRLMNAASKMERGPKFKSGGSKFPDLTGDGKVTQADVLKGRGVFKKGGSAKKKK